MRELKNINKEAIPRAIEKIDRYRLLNDPIEAESICRDILIIEPDNQEALVRLLLSLTDQFNEGVSSKEPLSILPKLKDEYQQEYYRGIIFEREAKATLVKRLTDFKYDAYEWLEDAMECFEKADKLSSSENKDAILRYNACLRTIEKYHLVKRPPDAKDRLHLPLE